MKKTIIALTAASSVVLASGVAIAEDTPAETPAVTTSAAPAPDNTGGEDDDTENPADDKEGGEAEDNKNSSNGVALSGDNSLSSNFFNWDAETDSLGKIKDIAAAIAGIVGILGSIVTLFATIEKLTKSFKK